MKRLLLYSHDSYGLGHIRRNLALATGLTRQLPDAEIVIASGSPKAHSFRLPPRTSIVQLPGVTTDRKGRYCPRDASRSLEEVLAERTALLDATVATLDPDLILVDHSPLGLGGELVDVLWRAREARPDRAIVLGMRDIYDGPEETRRSWAESGIDAALEDLYDLILVYGQRSIFSPLVEYGVSDAVAAKTVFTGYVHADEPADPSRVREQLGGDPLVLVTVGGGGDGEALVQNYLEGLASLGGPCGWRSLVVTGPLMDPRARLEANELACELPGVDVVEFTPRMADCVAAADLVVAMGGYNTTVEVLGRNKRLLTVPRVFPRREQLVRAQRMGRAGFLEWVHPGRLTAHDLIEGVGFSLELPAPDLRALDLGGVQNAARTIGAVLETGVCARPVECAA